MCVQFDYSPFVLGRHMKLVFPAEFVVWSVHERVSP